ncbi:hypothetical protein ACLED0_00365 [Lonsdalea quercina]|uniref:hypothetical protein n=1 Tax=Lonsdalea quercina TaxID=71657 RepID=UPI0039771305
MNEFKIPTSLSSLVVRAVQCIFARKFRQRREAGAALHLLSILNKYVVDCEKVASDNGYSPFEDPAGYDYRDRKARSEDAILTLPVIPDHELLPIHFIEKVRVIENFQSDIFQRMRKASEYDDGSGDQYYAERQKIFAELGLRAVLLSKGLRSKYGFTPPSSEHNRREIILDRVFKYHSDFSKRLRLSERRHAQQAAVAGELTQEKYDGH